MRIYTNQQRIKNNRRVAQVLFFVSLAILIGGLVVTNTIGRNDVLLLSIPCIVMPLGLVTTWISVRLTNQYIREPHPEDAIQAALKGINQNSTLYNYLFKANHVLVSPDGVYAFVTRFQDGPLKVEGDKVTDYRARGIMGRFLSFMRQEQMGHPFEEAREAAAPIQEIINEAVPGVSVIPAVVFTSAKSKIEVIDPVLPVVVTRKDKEPSMKTLRRDSKRKNGQLTTEQVAAIEKALNTTLAIEGQSEETVEAGDEE